MKPLKIAKSRRVVNRLFAALLLFVLSAGFVSAKTVIIGLQTNLDTPTAEQSANALAAYLHSNIPEHEFKVVAMGTKGVKDAAEAKRIDYAIVYAQTYILLKERYGATRIATMTTHSGTNGAKVPFFGGVIFARSNSVDIDKPQDIEGKRVAAGNPNAMGSYLFQIDALEELGVRIRPQNTRFLGSQIVGSRQDLIVEEVISGRADVGFVRTGLLEDMARDGKLDMKKIKIINPQYSEGFALPFSTKLYPEWPFVAMPNSDIKLSEKILSLLLRDTDTAHVDSDRLLDDWTIPQDYTITAELMRKYKLEPFDKTPITLQQALHEKRYYIASTAFMIILTLSVLSAYLIKNIARRKRLEIELVAHKDELEEAVKERTAQLEGANKDLQEINDELHTVFDTSKDGIAILDLESNFLEFNKAYLQMTGYAREELLKMSCVGMSVPEDVPRAIAVIEEVMVKGYVSNFEKTCIRKDASRVTINMAISMMPDGKRLLISAKDVTKQKEMEQNLRNMNSHLQEIVEKEVTKRTENEKILIHQSRLAIMGEMLSMVGHQWRQPLNVLALNIQDIAYVYGTNELDADYMQEFRNHSMNIIKNMSKVVNDFSDFFKPSGEKESFVLELAIKEAVEIIEPILVSNSIKVIFEISAEHGYYGFKSELEQAVLALIVNAMDAVMQTKPSEPYIKIDVFDTEDDTVEIGIEDNGGGIPEEIIDKIFDPYFSAKSKNGSGIGLYMTKEIVERHSQGIVTVKNTGVGARFVIRLHAKKAWEN
jgi:PAS domain S-box-containing protein